jgi:hypothetical protein
LGFGTTTDAIIGKGTLRPFNSVGRVAIGQGQKSIPLTIKKVGDRHHLTLDRASLEAVQLLDPLTTAELDNLEFSPLLFCYVILLRNSAEQLAQQIVSDQSNFTEKTAGISQTSLRIALYGYLVSQVFGSRGGEELGKLYNSRNPNALTLITERADSSPQWSQKELLDLGIELSEKERTPPRELARMLLTRYQSPTKKP